MRDDQQAIRDLIAIWMRASAAGDANALLSLMAEDVVFLVPGQPPMRGRDAFVTGFRRATERFRIDAKSDVQEIRIAGELAYCWNHLEVTMTPHAAGSPTRRAGYTLTILRKQPDGAWVISRDANLLTAGPTSN